ncbi:MAG: O-antigen ligase family protein [Patescibacteria group bacterium]|nr:O-antigen ligase family protein [Patescibacteria group bacterium]
MKLISDNIRHSLNIIHKYIFYVFVFLLPWQTIWIVREVFFDNEKWQYGTIGIYLSDILLVVLISLSIYLYKNHILLYITKNKKLIISALLFLLWGFASTLLASDKLLALYFSFKLLLAFNLFFLVQIIPIKIRTMSFVLIGSIFIQNILGLYQFVTQNTFAQKLFGISHYDVWRGGTAIINTADERWLRMYGAMPHPNMFGGLLLCGLLLSVYLYITTKKSASIVQIFLLTSIAMTTSSIILTFSRITWITSCVGIFALIIFIFKSRYYNTRKLLAPSLLILMTALLFFGTLHHVLFSRVAHDTTYSHNSISDRHLYMNHAKQLIAKNPIFGSGIGNYTTTIFHIDNHTYPIWYYQPVHNIYILTIAEIGIIGFILFTIFFILVFHQIYTKRKNIKIANCAFLITTISILLIAFFDHWPITSHFGLLFLFFILGLSLPRHAR